MYVVQVARARPGDTDPRESGEAREHGDGGREDPLAHRERLPSATEPPPRPVQREGQGEGERAGPRERPGGDHREEPRVPAFDEEQERQRQPQEPQRLGVAELHDRRHRGDAEEHDREEGTIRFEESRHQPVEDQGGAESRGDGDRHRRDVPRHGQPCQHADQGRIRREERPGVLGDVASVGQRRVGGVPRERDDLVPARVPHVGVLEVPGPRRRPRVRALHAGEREHEHGRHGARGGVHQRDLRPPGQEPPTHPRRGARRAERVALPFDRRGGHPTALRPRR